MARPSLIPSPAQRDLVATAAGAGARHEDIALALGVARGTLTKYFERELRAGAAARRMEALQGLFRAARKGRAGAAREYLKRSPEPLDADHKSANA